MLQVLNGAVTETMTAGYFPQYSDNAELQASNCVAQYGYWNSYPVYICHDKTKKAIEVLKALEADGLKVQSVKKFIELVEKISAVL